MSCKFTPGDLIRFNRRRSYRSVASSLFRSCASDIDINTTGIIISVMNNHDDSPHRVEQFIYVVTQDGVCGWVQSNDVFEKTISIL